MDDGSGISDEIIKFLEAVRNNRVVVVYNTMKSVLNSNDKREIIPMIRNFILMDKVEDDNDDFKYLMKNIEEIFDAILNDKISTIYKLLNPIDYQTMDLPDDIDNIEDISEFYTDIKKRLRRKEKSLNDISLHLDFNLDEFNEKKKKYDRDMAEFKVAKEQYEKCRQELIVCKKELEEREDSLDDKERFLNSRFEKNANDLEKRRAELEEFEKKLILTDKNLQERDSEIADKDRQLEKALNEFEFIKKSLEKRKEELEVKEKDIVFQRKILERKNSHNDYVQLTDGEEVQGVCCKVCNPVKCVIS